LNYTRNRASITKQAVLSDEWISGSVMLMIVIFRDTATCP